MNNDNNVLDTIIAQGNTRPVVNSGDVTAKVIHNVEAHAYSQTAYRGLGWDVRTANNNPQMVQEMAQMGWKVVPMPLAIQGKNEVRPYPGMVALVRSDTGDPLSVASTDYKPHQNGHLIKTMTDFASESGLILSRVGTFNHGSRGFAIATSGVNRAAKIGDMVAMHIILKFGHAPGTATSFRVMALELRCGNGAIVEVAAGNARFVHSAELTPERISVARTFVHNAANAFNGYVDKLAMLRTVKSNKGIDLLQLAQLFQPELASNIAGQLVRQSNATPGDVRHEVLGARVIDALLSRDSSQQLVATMIQEHGERLLNKVIAATVVQPGGEMTVGTLAHAYSGVTNFNSNVRGRSAETGLEANLFGTYQQDSARALNLAVQVAGTMRSMN